MNMRSTKEDDMTHTFEEIKEALERSENWGELEDKKKAKIAGVEMQLMRL